MITGIDTGDSIFKVDESGDGVDAVLFRFGRIINFDERDSFLIALVVNVLQFGQYGDAVRFVFIVCINNGLIQYSVRSGRLLN